MATGDDTAGAAICRCPLPSCDWTLTQAPPDPFAAGPVTAGETLGESISLASMAILTDWYAEAERAVEAHVSTHAI